MLFLEQETGLATLSLEVPGSVDADVADPDVPYPLRLAPLGERFVSQR